MNSFQDMIWLKIICYKNSVCKLNCKSIQKSQKAVICVIIWYARSPAYQWKSHIQLNSLPWILSIWTIACMLIFSRVFNPRCTWAQLSALWFSLKWRTNLKVKSWGNSMWHRWWEKKVELFPIEKLLHSVYIFTDKINEYFGVPIVAHRKWIWLASMRMQVQSPASLSGVLRIWHCHELWCRSQMWLGSGVAVAVV